MTAFSISLPLDVQAQINSFAAQYSVDALVASAVAQVSSGGRQFFSDGSLVVTPYGIGVMGIGKMTAVSLGFDATEESQNIQAGVAYLSLLLQQTVGNYPQAIAAYITSIDAVQTANGVPPLAPVQNFVFNVSTLSAQAGSTSASALYALRNQTTGDPFDIAGNLTHESSSGVNYGSGKNASQGAANLDKLQASMEPALQTYDPTMGATAWYADTGLVTGNPRIRASAQPVSFTVFLDRNDPNQFLQNPYDLRPIEIQLNTSLAAFEIASKHVYNRTPSRTGMHITLWGMQPDLISGTGTTGVFMNQFGLTDFFSVANITDDVAQLVSSGFSHSFKQNFSPFDASVTTTVSQQNRAAVRSQTGNLTTTAQQGFNLVNTVQQNSTGEVFNSEVIGSDSVASQAINNLELDNPSEAFRVAAQDCFMEFLKLFQMNGSVYYYAQDYATDSTGKGANLGIISNQEQVSPTAWSFKTGASSFQQHSRNNDVMARGYVAMRYRNNVYLGYFKSLQWTQDAESPFQWKFSFTFQVERTYTALYFPNVSVTQIANLPGGGPQTTTSTLPDQIT